MNVKLLTFDASTNKTGVAIFNNGFLEDYCLIDLHTNKDPDSRIDQMIEAMYEQMDIYCPNVVYIEDNYASQKDCRNVRTVKMLSIIMGAVRGYCVSHGIEYHTIYPSEWRKWVYPQGGKERDDLKAMSLEYVFNNHGITLDSDDVCDAICIGTGIINYYNSLCTD